MYRLLLSMALIIASAALPFHSATAETDINITAVQADVDFTKYSKFMVRPLDIDETVLIPPPWVEGSDGKPRPWNISKKNASFLQQQYYAAMQKQLEEIGGYALADSAGDDVLAVEIEIISLTPWAKTDDKVITKGSGEMTFRAEIRDSMTRELLVMYEGETPVGEDYQEHTEFSVDQNVNALFNQWGEFLRQGLNTQKSGAAD